VVLAGFLFRPLRLWFSSCRVFKFSFVFSSFVLPLVKVLVNCRFWSIGFSFGQVSLAQVLFFGFVRGWFCRFSKLACLLRSAVLANYRFHSASSFLNQLVSGRSKLAFACLAFWQVLFLVIAKK
jgi:hypothetical protein